MPPAHLTRCIHVNYLVTESQFHVGNSQLITEFEQLPFFSGTQIAHKIHVRPNPSEETLCGSFFSWEHLLRATCKQGPDNLSEVPEQHGGGSIHASAEL